MATSQDEVVIPIQGSADKEDKKAAAAAASPDAGTTIPVVTTAEPGKPRAGPELAGFILFFGLATMGAGMGGFFARSPPPFYGGDFAAYYRRLPWFIALGVAEICVSMWVTGDPAGRDGVAVLVMLVSVPMLMVTIGFSGI